MAKPDPNTTQRTVRSDGPGQSAPRTACVVVIRGEGIGRRADIADEPILIGRAEDADLHFSHRSVSREHCRIWRDGDAYRVRDLGATNTTRVNEAKIGESPLVDGDHLTIGDNILKFISHSSVEAHYHEEIYQLATHDALTGLCNRRQFSELLDKEIARTLRHRRALSLCIVDVDLFKPINDRHGHIAGDGVLQRLAAMLQQHARNDDVAARIGGEEFAVMLPECGVEAARLFAERLREAIAGAVFTPGGEPQRITISIGIAELSTDRNTRQTLMAAADAGLYRAKSEGRNRVCIEG